MSSETSFEERERLAEVMTRSVNILASFGWFWQDQGPGIVANLHRIADRLTLLSRFMSGTGTVADRQAWRAMGEQT